MAFETTEIASVELVQLSSRDADDGALSDFTGCMTDGATDVSCDEWQAGSEGMRIEFNVPLSAWTGDISIDEGSPDKMDISEIITHTV